MDLPKTERLTPRPVWERYRLRQMRNLEPMPLPTDEEKADAILVLSDTLNMLVPELWEEASRIFEEASV